MNNLVYIMFLISCASVYYAQNDLSIKSCATESCHESMIKKSHIHSPVNDGCGSCHEKNNGKHPDDNGNEFILLETGSDLCETCHEKEVNQKIVHVPFYEENCLSCHSPHSSDLQAMLNGNNQKTICEKCHNTKNAGNEFGHGPYMSNQCLSCHVGHQSKFESLIVDKVPGLCFQCHQEKKEILELSNIHPVYEDGCLECHSPHTSPANNMLLNGENELCYQCHESVKNNVMKAKIVHDPLNQEGQCVSCHSPHAGILTNLLLDKQPDLCFKCHSENTKNKEKYIDILGCIKKEYLHEPLADGQCDDCHLHHVSNNYHLLKAAFPKGNYTTPKVESFALCFQCHDSQKITEKTSKTVTNFRNGTKNLHYVHVMKKKSISCQSCHDMHGADNKHIIGNVVYFGNWEMPIGYKVSETGGSCLPGCHVNYSYDREKL